jgi:uncharacterized protein YjbJ (UPF0337 family)
MLKNMKIDFCPLRHIRIAGWAAPTQAPILDTRATCPNEHRHGLSIPLRCYLPKKIEALRGQLMKPSARDEIKGKLHEVKGNIKEKAGQLTNDPDLETEGQTEKIAGKVQRKIGQVEKVLET